MKLFLKKLSFRFFKILSRFGVYVVPAHYYVPLANVNQLEETKEIWAKKSDLSGIVSDPDEQVNNLWEICLPNQKEFTGNKIYLSAVKNHFGPGYGFVEAQALHGFIRSYQPKKIIEVAAESQHIACSKQLKPIKKKKMQILKSHVLNLFLPIKLNLYNMLNF